MCEGCLEQKTLLVECTLCMINEDTGMPKNYVRNFKIRNEYEMQVHCHLLGMLKAIKEDVMMVGNIPKEILEQSGSMKKKMKIASKSNHECNECGIFASTNCQQCRVILCQKCFDQIHQGSSKTLRRHEFIENGKKSKKCNLK